ncbi:MIP/aquaporin family protein [Marinoscillum furvescens]|uniref:Glycerol uptake facilitator protein n=1 Tax=Marinoscillum furvescens DSM 4134 TaxID=1122208 RepID=A0A3D9KZR0_MARFU|nr:MIP/aquaporin family protein [Marinoscillum furvescens]RED94904.1 glycerol uptake facilitator protein [Marinoscillum furvescens DSM 4134]
MSPFISEIVGTFILMVLGNGVNANVSLNKTYGNNSGWIVIALGWGLAVFVAVYIAGATSGAHINPAVTLGLAMTGKFPWATVPQYILAQMIGAFLGAGATYIQYRPHFSATDNPDTKLGLFCTGPAIPKTLDNLASEIIGTFVLVFGVLFLVSGDGLGSLSALPVALLVVSIGLSLGGTTGYAINPARDLGPRIFHAVAPIRGKRDSNWRYAWIPIAGPMIGAALAAIVYSVL